MSDSTRFLSTWQKISDLSRQQFLTQQGKKSHTQHSKQSLTQEGNNFWENEATISDSARQTVSSKLSKKLCCCFIVKFMPYQKERICIYNEKSLRILLIILSHNIWQIFIVVQPAYIFRRTSPVLCILTHFLGHLLLSNFLEKKKK